jgi:predicted nucleic acid-binding protein
MQRPVFVDTNILVYARDSGFPAKQESAHRLLADLWRERSGRLSVQVLNEYYVTVTRKLKPGMSERDAWEDLQIFAAWEPLALDFATLQKAREIQGLEGLAWRDCMIVASAILASCRSLVSEDLAAGKVYAGLRVVNPFAE